MPRFISRAVYFESGIAHWTVVKNGDSSVRNWSCWEKYECPSDRRKHQFLLDKPLSISISRTEWHAKVHSKWTARFFSTIDRTTVALFSTASSILVFLNLSLCRVSHLKLEVEIFSKRLIVSKKLNGLGRNINWYNYYLLIRTSFKRNRMSFNTLINSARHSL